ncbi:hypothetical protein [Clostridium estertheticum]|uniref:hypothetical protein n=1 Tax=Clostridium estertheticum TaxID=238834 RepID=UPI001C0DBB8B|nr:hypothetical protein [Clostridium estertheticum]MBU3173274.1 hypothetical protein [Clostridium estertheticum]
MNYFKITNELEKVRNKMDWVLKEDIKYQIEMFIQHWDNKSGACEKKGEKMITEQMTYVVYNIELGNAFIFFDGDFAYKTEINDKFMEDLKVKSIAGLKTYWIRYGMDKHSIRGANEEYDI